MKQLVAIAIASMFVVSASQAGSSCCGSKKDGSSAKLSSKSESCGGVFDQLNLTDEQKAQFAELKANCDKSDCSKTGYQKFMDGAHKILTEEQMAKCRSICAENGWQCPMEKSTTEAKAEANNEG